MRKPTDNPALYKVLGRNIAAARSRFGNGKLSQSGLATKVGLTRGSIANIELGTQRPPVHVVWAIAQALDVELSELLPNRAELRESAASVTPAVVLNQAVARVVNEEPLALAWLSMTSAKVAATPSEPPSKRKRP